MKRKIFLFMGIVVAACIIWIGCDGSMPEMYKIKGGDVAYYIGDSTGFGFEGPTNEDDTFSFWFMVRESMWESTLRSDCQEVGCYVFVNDITGALFLTSSLRTPKIFIKEFGDFLMSCHQHCLGVNLLVQR